MENTNRKYRNLLNLSFMRVMNQAHMEQQMSISSHGGHGDEHGVAKGLEKALGGHGVHVVFRPGKGVRRGKLEGRRWW
jgi:hypothetical protein